MRISDWSSDVCSSDLNPRADSHVLRTRAPLDPKVSFDLHVLGMPPAFVLSQDQTLKFDVPLHRGGMTPIEQQIGRASCRERVCQYVSISVVAVSLKTHKDNKENNNRH